MGSLKSIVFLGLGLLVMPAVSMAFVVDGNLADWGVNPGVYTGVLRNPDMIPTKAGIFSEVEDHLNNFGPGSGGQKFDAEAMYASIQDSYLYFAIVTGMPKGGDSGELPGDIAFDFNDDGSYEFGIATIGTDAHKVNGHKAGELYSVVDKNSLETGWNRSTWWPAEVAPTTMKNDVDLVKFVSQDTLEYKNSYKGAGTGNNHWVIEGRVATANFGSKWGQNFAMSWTETCGNDVIKLHVAPVPEPATMALLGMGFTGLMAFRRRIMKV